MRKSRLKILPARSLLTLGFLLLYLSCPTIGEMFRVQPDYGFKSFDQPELKCYTRLTETEDSLLIGPSADLEGLNRTDKDKDLDTFGILKYEFRNESYSNAGEGPKTTVVVLDSFNKLLNEPFVARDQRSSEFADNELEHLSRQVKSREFSLARKRSLHRKQIQQYRASIVRLERSVVRKQRSLWMRDVKSESRGINDKVNFVRHAHLRRYENRQNSETKQRKSNIHSEFTGLKQFRRLTRDRESSDRSNNRRKYKHISNVDVSQSRNLAERRMERSFSQKKLIHESLRLSSDTLTFRRSLHSRIDSRKSKDRRLPFQQNRSTIHSVSISETKTFSSETLNDGQIKSHERETNIRASRANRQTSYGNQFYITDRTERFSTRATNKAIHTREVSNNSDNSVYRRSSFRRGVNERVSQEKSVERRIQRDTNIRHLSRRVNNELVKSRHGSLERLSHESIEQSNIDRISERRNIVKPNLIRAASEPTTSRDRRNILMKRGYFVSGKPASPRASSEQKDTRRITREIILKHRYTAERHASSETRKLIVNSDVRKQAMKSRALSDKSVSLHKLTERSEARRISNERTKERRFDNRGASRNGRMLRETNRAIVSDPVSSVSTRISPESMSSERIVRTSRYRLEVRRYVAESHKSKINRDTASSLQYNKPVRSRHNSPEIINRHTSLELTRYRHVLTKKPLEHRNKNQCGMKQINESITSQEFRNEPKGVSLDRRIASERSHVLRFSLKQNSARKVMFERQLKSRRFIDKSTHHRFSVKNSYFKVNDNEAENTSPAERRVIRSVNRDEYKESRRRALLERPFSRREISRHFTDGQFTVRHDAKRSHRAERCQSRTIGGRLAQHPGIKSRSFERSNERYIFLKRHAIGRFTIQTLVERKHLSTRRLYGLNSNKNEQQMKHFLREKNNSFCLADGRRDLSALVIQQNNRTISRTDSTTFINHFMKHSQNEILRSSTHTQKVTTAKNVLGQQDRYRSKININKMKNSKLHSVTSPVDQMKLGSAFRNTRLLSASLLNPKKNDAYTKSQSIAKLKQEEYGSYINWIHIILEPAKQIIFLLAMVFSVKHDKMWSFQSVNNALFDFLKAPDTEFSDGIQYPKELKTGAHDYKFTQYFEEKILENGPSRLWFSTLQ